MYGQCLGDFGIGPCVYDGPPRPLTGDEAQLQKANLTIAQLVKETCPLYGDADLCCSVGQLLDLKHYMEIVSTVGMARCPSCFENFRRFSCDITCSPWQSRFSRVTQSAINEFGGDTVVEILCYISKKFVYSYYESCEGITGFIPGTYMFDYGVCGSWGRARCSPERWLNFTGQTPGTGGHSPIRIHYRLSVHKVIKVKRRRWWPLEAATKRCSESAGPGLAACSCNDCEEACSEVRYPDLPPEPEPFVILGFDGQSVISGAVFVLAVVCIALFVVFRRRETDLVSEYDFSTSRKMTLIDKGDNNCSTGVCLGSPEEIEPLRSKLRPAGILPMDLEDKAPAPQDLGLRFEKELESGFTRWTELVCRRPVSVMSVSLSISVLLSTAAFLRFELTVDPVDLWVSRDSRAREDMEYFNKHFEPFYRIQQLIVTPTNKDVFHYPIIVDHEWTNISWGPVFRQEFLVSVLELQEAVESLTGRSGNSTVTLKDVCLAPLKPLNEECAIQSPFAFFQNKKEFFGNESNYLSHFMSCSRSPREPRCATPYGGPVDSTEVVVGGHEGSDYFTAQALIITIPTRNYYEAHKNLESEAWEARFLEFMKNFSHPLMEIAYKAERSIEDEIKRSSKSDALMVSISYLFMFCYLTLALGQFRSFRTFLIESKFTLGFFGVNIVLLSIMASFGLCSLAGYSMTLIVLEVVPFLVLAVGVDNIFILVQTFQREERRMNQSLEQHISVVVGKVAPSMFLSSVSMASCFFIGASSEMPAVRLFALCAGFALILNFLLQMTVFLPLFIWDCRRQENLRLDICCCHQMSKIPGQSVGVMEEGLLYKTFKNLYAPYLMKDTVRCIVAIIFLGWFCSSVAVLHKIEVGLEPKLAVPEDSYMIRYFQAIEKHLSVGPPVYFVLTDGYNYSNEKAQSKVCSSHASCDSDSLTTQLGVMAKLKNRTYIAFQPVSWMDSYYEFLKSETCCFKYRGNGSHCPSHVQTKETCESCRSRDPSRLPEADFVKRLDFFLSDSPSMRCAKGGKAQFGSAVELVQENNKTRIGATNFMTYHTVLKTSQDFYEALKWSRQISENLTRTMNSSARVFAYSFVHVFYEQYLTMWRDTLQGLGLSTLAIFSATLLLTGLDLRSSVLVALTVLATVVDLMALMFWWEISLNALSLVNLVVAAGISVEFCSHITRSFALSERPSPVERAQEALCQMGTSVLSGITLTDCGILVLAFAKSQIFRVFYFRMYLGTIAFGTLHGLVLLPVLLSCFGPPAKRRSLDRETFL